MQTKTQEKIEDLKKYETYYTISNFGYITSKRTGKALRQESANKKKYVRLYKDEICTNRNIDELVLEQFHSRYNGQEITHKDDDSKNCHIDNLIFDGRYLKSNYAKPIPKEEQFDYVIYYETSNGDNRMFDSKSKLISTCKIFDSKLQSNRFHMFKGYENKDENENLLPMTDENLLLFAHDFQEWIKQLANNDTLKIVYTKYYTHYAATEFTFKRLCKGLYENFESITSEEDKLFDKCHNGGHTYFGKAGVYECFGYDFTANYPTIMASEKLKIPTKKYTEYILNELPNRSKIELGIYKVKISSENEDFKKVFSFSKKHHYTDTSLKFAIKHKKRFDVKIELIKDGETNGYIYHEYTTGDKIFKNWFDTLLNLKKQFPKNKLVKNILSTLWGTITHKQTINKTYEQIGKEGIKIDVDVVIIDKIKKGSNDDNEYYILAPMNDMYRYNIRIKPFLTAMARVNIANVTMENDNVDYLIRTQTDGSVFTKEIDCTNFDGFIPEEKTTGTIKWMHVNKYKKI
jgi:hypothetical protein